MYQTKQITPHKTKKRNEFLRKVKAGNDWCTLSPHRIATLDTRTTVASLKSFWNGCSIPSHVMQGWSKDKMLRMLTSEHIIATELANDFTRLGIVNIIRCYRAAIIASNFGSLYDGGQVMIDIARYSQSGEIVVMERDTDPVSEPEPIEPIRIERVPIEELEPTEIDREIENILKEEPELEPEPVRQEPESKKTDPLYAVFESLLEPMVKRLAESSVSEDRIRELILEHSTGPHVIKIPDPVKGPDVSPELAHKKFPDVLLAASQKINVMLIGPAGSGKTTTAEQIAKALSVPFRFSGAIDSPYKLTGFVDAASNVVRTAFRECYEHGGLFLFDEIDASSASAVLALNAALANNSADFPDGVVEKHPDFYCIAAANTFGHGADRVYVGRNQLDGATLDRFVVIEFDYDDALERSLVGSEGLEWCLHVQKVRRAVFRLKLRHVVSPRSSIFGARLLAAGMDRSVVETMTVFKGMDKETRAKIEMEMSLC